MKILTLNDFKPEWLKHRIYMCALPTEIVVPNKYTGEMSPIILDAVYGYRYYVPVYKQGRTNYKSEYAIEVHEDYGSDGHIDFTFMGEFMVIDDESVLSDFNYNKYMKLIAEYHDLKYKMLDDENQQLTFFDYRNWWRY